MKIAGEYMKRLSGKEFVRVLFIIGVLIISGFFTSCDFSINNPGPVQDEQLNNADTFSTLVNGMEKSFARAQNWLAYTGAAVAKQVTAAGSIGQFGITTAQRKGSLLPSEDNDHWAYAQQARWLAEDGIRRMREQLGDEFSSSALGAEALLFNGYANRLLGENMCSCVIDGGAPEENRVYFERAEANFSEAIEILKNIDDTELLTAAYAGRASVRIFLDNWDDAVIDAAEVPMNFIYASSRSDIQQEEYNRIYWANANQPYRAHSVIDTYYETYYEEYNDPRVSWDTDPDIPFGDGGTVPWLFQTKYNLKESTINLSSGHEMVLIRAEAELRSGNWQVALDLINSLRQQVGVDPWQGSNETEVWTNLKRERGIELWLESRRLGDLRRWTEEGTPGEMVNMEGRDLCFPISQDEQETNDNLN